MDIEKALETIATLTPQAAEIRKALDAAKKIVLAAAGDAAEITTTGWTAYIKRTPAERLDTAALYRDFPDIKTEYGKKTESVSIDVHARTVAERISA